MKNELLGILAAVAMAACGSKTPPSTTPPSTTPTPDTVGDGDGDHDSDMHGEQKPTEPEPPPPDPAQVKAELLAAETAAYQAAKPVFDKYCASCHEKGGKKASAKKLGHLDITTYPFGGHHTMEVAVTIRKALGIGGGKATMPFNKPGAVQGDELALIAAWADAFDASHAGGAHEGHDAGGHHH